MSEGTLLVILRSGMIRQMVSRNEPRVILSAAKDLLEGIGRRTMILRFAQDDTSR